MMAVFACRLNLLIGWLSLFLSMKRNGDNMKNKIIFFKSDADIFNWLLDGKEVFSLVYTDNKSLKLVNGNKTFCDGTSAANCLLSYKNYYGKES
jgi:hypothetical protein